jgi:PEGA domain-containing protein
MTTVPLSTDRPEAPLFSDGLGDRVVAADGATGELLQILRIRPALTAVPSFEFALRERAARLANFRHAYYARVRRIDRVQVPAPGLAIVSDHVEGTRLSEILRVAHERNLQLDINAALCLIRQLVPAVALLHENAREVAHGLIAPERLVVTPHARLVIVEHVMAAAVEQLQFSRDRLWQEFRIAMPPAAGAPRFDHRADVTGVGLVALALILGRPLAADEFPHKISALVNDARERGALGEVQALSAPLREWLARALQLDSRRAFASAPEALSALEDVLADDSTYVAAPVSLETFLSRYIAALLEPVPTEVPAAHAAVTVTYPSHVAPARAAHDRTSIQESAASFTDMPAHPAMREAPRPSQPEPARPTAGPGRIPHPSNPLPTVARPIPADVTRVSPQPPPASQPAGTRPITPVPPPAVPWTPNAPAVFAEEPSISAKNVDPQAGAAGQPVREITELLSASELPLPPPAPRPLFDEEPFTVPAAPAPAKKKPAGKKGGSMRIVAGVAAALAVLASGGYFAWRYLPTGSAAASPQMGTLVVESNPAGVQVFVDGIDRGQTPSRLSVTPGAHILELRGRGVPRVIPLNVAAGAQVSQYLEFADTPSTGQLRVQSQPAGAKVLVDGVDKGVAPITVTELTPGDHEVVLQTPTGSVRQVVTVQAGGVASLVAPVTTTDAAATGPVSGWVTVKAPVALEIREGGKLLGTSDADRVMMAAGRHELELVNEMLGYKALRVVQVPAGKVAPLAIELPNGVVNLNATPWAEVWIDGQRVGETPIGNLSVPVGPHEIVFKNPQLGEKRHAISVTLGTPVRLSVDMR